MLNPSTMLVIPAMDSKARLILERPGSTEQLRALVSPLFRDTSLPKPLPSKLHNTFPRRGPLRVFAFSLAERSIAVDEPSDDGGVRQAGGEALRPSNSDVTPEN